MAILQQEPGGDAHHEERAGHPRAEHDVLETGHRRGVEHEGPEVGDLGARAAGPLDDVVAGRRLHPGVRDDDPDRAEVGAQGDHQRAEEMRAGRQHLPAEEQQREEARLEEEREDAFGGQRAAEDVADEARVGGPVRPELELHHQARGDADRERQREHARPEPRHLAPERVARLQVDPFRADQEDAEADRQGRIDVVKRDRQRELEAGELDQRLVHGDAPADFGYGLRSYRRPG